MAVRLAVVGPGRVGQALARRWLQAGVEVLGFVGRSPASVRTAIAFAGGGRELQLDDLVAAHVVVFAVGDPELPTAIAAVANANAARRCGLFVHTSGRHGLEVLAPLHGRGVRLGALHPVVPFATASTGLQQLAGRPAVLLGEPRARRLLERLAEWLQLRPIWGEPGGDRMLYHAACALAANGVTALRAAVDDVLLAAKALSPADAAIVADQLMTTALASAAATSPAAALSGPVVRGDAATVAAHRAALQRGEPRLDLVYRALMTQALHLAELRGLPLPAAAALRRALGLAMD